MSRLARKPTITRHKHYNMLKLIRVRFILLALLLGTAPSLSSADISITIAPPALPVYDQPLCPGDGYIWVPGYWAYGEDDYYWVPGAWVLAPQPGYLWTPGYWGFEGGNYGWHPGYWGLHIGFYGGVNYGFGYFGSGFVGGRWEGGRFLCNTAVWHVNATAVHNTYVDRTVIRNETVNRVSFNGPGGIDRRPTADEEATAREQRLEPTQEQRTHEENAARDTNQRFSVNKGNPTRVAVTKVGAREEVNRATTPEERKQGTKEVTTTKEQTTKEVTKGNEPPAKAREETTREKQKVNKQEGKEPAAAGKREEKPKAEAQNEHHEANDKPADEKAKGENKEKDKKQQPQ